MFLLYVRIFTWLLLKLTFKFFEWDISESFICILMLCFSQNFILVFLKETWQKLKHTRNLRIKTDQSKAESTRRFLLTNLPHMVWSNSLHFLHSHFNKRKQQTKLISSILVSLVIHTYLNEFRIFNVQNDQCKDF